MTLSFQSLKLSLSSFSLHHFDSFTREYQYLDCLLIFVVIVVYEFYGLFWFFGGRVIDFKIRSPPSSPSL